MKTYQFIPKILKKFKGKSYETAELIEINKRLFLREKRITYDLWRLQGTVYWQFLFSPTYFPGRIAEISEIEYYKRE
jgi:hypothetical protein